MRVYFQVIIVALTGLYSPLRAVPFQKNATEQPFGQVLKARTPIERKLAGGESQSYRVILESGQFLRASVEQKGVDVAVRLYAPGGEKLLDVDSPNGAWGLEPLTLVAGSTGDYRIEVSQLEPDATIGNYTIVVDEIRVSTQRDRDLSVAQRIYAEADELRNKATAESVRNAFSKYEEALKRFRLFADHRGEAASLFYMGTVRQMLGENGQAIDYLNQALPLWEAVNERTAVAVTLNNIGNAYNDSGEKAKAFEPLNRALEIYHSVGDKLQEAVTINNIGRVYEEAGDYHKALQHYTQVLPLFKETKRLRETAYTLVNIGVIHQRLGQYEKAIEYNGEALPLLQKIGDRRAEGAALVTLANIYFGLGSYQKALDVYDQALPVLRATGSRQAITQTLISTGKCYVLLGEKGKARNFLDQALEASRSLGDRSREAYTLNNIGLLLAESGDKAKAQDSYSQALVLMRRLKDLHGEALTLNNIGSLYASLGEKTQALDSLQQALAINRTLRERSEEGNTLASLMFAWRKFQLPSLAVFYGKQAVNVFQEVRTRVKTLDKELQASYLNSKEKVYRELADLLIDEGRLPEAQRVLAMLKEEEYFDFIRRDIKETSSLKVRADLTPTEAEWQKRYDEIADQLTTLGRERGELLAKQSRTAEEEQRLFKLESDLRIGQEAFQKFLDQLFREFSNSEVAKERVFQLQESQGLMEDLRELGSGAVAIYTLVGKDKYRIILVTPDAQRGFEYEIKDVDLNRKVAAFREVLEDPDLDPLPLAQELYQILVGPVAKDLSRRTPKL